MKVDDPSPQPQSPFLFGFIGLSILLGLLMPFLSRHYAMSWDEWTESNYGFMVLKYILSGGENTSYAGFLNTHLYSAFFSVLTGFLNGVFFDPLHRFLSDGFLQSDHFFDFFQFSHLMNSFFGFYLFFFTGLCAKEVKGWRTACLALILIAISPRIFAHSMNNHEDIPFATTYMLTAYLMIRFFKQIPKPSWKITSALSLAIGLTIGSRVGGVILMGYLFFFGIFFYYVHNRSAQEKSLPWIPWLGRLTIISLYGYLIGLFFWPYGQLNPFLNVFRALHQIANFPYSEGSILFQGRLFPLKGLPWTYLPVWIFISTPCVVLIGWLFFCLLLPSFRKNLHRKYIVFLAFIALFPLLFVILKHSVLYNDWRHLYFTYGPLVVLSALGWDSLFDLSRFKKIRLGLSLGFLLLASLPIFWMVRNHPYQALYFNELEGGLKGAAGRYEIDYWGNTLRTAAEWLGDYHLRHYPDRPAYVRAEGYITTTYSILREKLGSRYFPYLYPDDHLRSRQFRYMNVKYFLDIDAPGDWDYAILRLHNQTLQDLREGKWPPQNILFEIKIDGVPVCAVTKNPNSPLFREGTPS